MSNLVTGYRLLGVMCDPPIESFCKDCRCWYHVSEAVEEKYQEGPNAPVELRTSHRLVLSECRRHPKQLHPDGWYFPHADPFEWCGEFRA